MENKILIKCSCHGHMLQLEKDKEFLDISFWNLGQGSNSHDWKTRLQLIWRIITKGYPWSDMVILNKEEQEKLIKFLQDNNDEN